MAAPALAGTVVLPASTDPFEFLRRNTLGLGEPYPVLVPERVRDILGSWVPLGCEGDELPSTYVDSTATTLPLMPVVAACSAFEQQHYASGHSAHLKARIATLAFEEARDVVARFHGADPERQGVVFAGPGATGGANRIARNLLALARHSVGQIDPKRRMIITTEMEHHANIIVWQELFGRENVKVVRVDGRTGLLDLDHLRDLLREFGDQVLLVTVTAVSNVTGIKNPLSQISGLVHNAGASFMVDAAQATAHRPIDMQGQGIDFLVFSSHKFYAPGAPGGLIMPAWASPPIPTYLGGAIVDFVSLARTLYTQGFPQREEAGTQDVLGAVMAAAALQVLEFVGMDKIVAHENRLTAALIEELSSIAGVTVYGDTDVKRTPRAGVISFNIEGLHHAKAAAAASDYAAVFMRDGCFCAGPHVFRLLGMEEGAVRAYGAEIESGNFLARVGLIRASLGIYNNLEDVMRVGAVTRWLAGNRERIEREYALDPHGHVYRVDGRTVDLKPYSPLLKATERGLVI